MVTINNNQEEVLEIFKRVNSFSCLPSALLDELCKNSVLMKLKKNATIWDKGEPSRFFVLVSSGLVEISKKTSDGTHSILALIGPLDVCGLSAFIKKGPYPANAKVVSDTATLVKVYVRTMDPFIYEKYHKELSACLKENLLAHEHVLREKIDILTARSVAEKAFILLKHLSNRFSSTPFEDRAFIPFSISKTQIANIVEARIETTIRLLNKWEKLKLIQFSKKGVDIPSLRDIETQVRK